MYVNKGMERNVFKQRNGKEWNVFKQGNRMKLSNLNWIF